MTALHFMLHVVPISYSVRAYLFRPTPYVHTKLVKLVSHPACEQVALVELVRTDHERTSASFSQTRDDSQSVQNSNKSVDILELSILRISDSLRNHRVGGSRCEPA